MPSRINRQRLKFLGGCGAIGMLIFGPIYTGFQPSPPATLVWVAISGFMLGALAAPILDPKLFPTRERWQAPIGAAGGILFAVATGLSLPMIATAAVTGAVWGALANYWLEYIW
jgi:hypothetical protein